MNKFTTPLDYARMTIDTMLKENERGNLEDKKSTFNYHMGVFLSGMFNIYQLCGEESWIVFIKEWVDSLIDEEGNILGKFRNRLDDFQAGNLLYPLYQKSGEEKYKLALDKLINLIDIYPRNKEGGFWHMERFPNQMWLDGLYMGGPLICKYADMFGQPEYFDIAAAQALLMQEKTRDAKSGLWYHAYDCERTADWADKITGCSPEFWGRSLGWVPIAILEELDYIPPEHNKYEVLCQSVKEMLVAICEFQQEDGRWYQVVDKAQQAGNWPETSCTCLFTAALCKAVRKHILDEKYLKFAQKGYEGIIKNLTWNGNLIEINNVCVGTGVGDYKYYCERKKCTNDLHGVGAFLLMCSEVYRV